jgi:hypothetical protein
MKGFKCHDLAIIQGKQEDIKLFKNKISLLLGSIDSFESGLR